MSYQLPETKHDTIGTRHASTSGMCTTIAPVSPCCARVIAAQAAAVEALQVELAALVAAENEYHAHMVREEIDAAGSLARLVHKHECP